MYQKLTVLITVLIIVVTGLGCTTPKPNRVTELGNRLDIYNKTINGYEAIANSPEELLDAAEELTRSAFIKRDDERRAEAEAFLSRLKSLTEAMEKLNETASKANEESERELREFRERGKQYDNAIASLADLTHATQSISSATLISATTIEKTAKSPSGGIGGKLEKLGNTCQGLGELVKILAKLNYPDNMNAEDVGETMDEATVKVNQILKDLEDFKKP